MTKCRGVFSTGTLGVGYCLFDPWASLISDGGIAGGADLCSRAVIYTNVNYASDHLVWASAGGVFTTAGVVGAQTNSIFPGASLAGKECRLVCAGLRCRYIGTDFRNQGRVILYRSQGNNNIAHGGTIDGNALLNDFYTATIPVSRKTEYVYYLADTASLLGYQVWDGNFNGYSNAAQQHYSYLIFIDGGDTVTPQSWEFETVSYFELTGSFIALTKSESDPSGFGAVMSSLPTTAPTITSSLMESNFMKSVAAAVVNSTSTYFGMGPIVPMIAQSTAKTLFAPKPSSVTITEVG